MNRRLGLLLTGATVLLAAGAASVIGAGRSQGPNPRAVTIVEQVSPGAERAQGTQRPPLRRPRPPVPPLLVSVPAGGTATWRTVARVHGRDAAWLAQRGGVSLVRFDQGLVHMDLHAGSSDGGSEGWRYGDRITPGEIHLVLAAVNGGFKLSYPNVGFVSGGHVAVALKPGLASIVTYTDGTTDIGAWGAGVPSPQHTVFSVLQNQHLLVDGGVAAESVSGCISSCWGETVGGRSAVARSALGITATGQLVWAAGEQLLPSELASALIAAGAVRAVELDINPDWVAGYLYVHHPGGPSAVPVVPGQLGIGGRLLEPYSRDFLTFVAD
ncbi:MAG TPA: hypothetical protein VKG62_03785 [Solirubrobacteraceae bacterium]|nr:hypothetical protein [Solirubrobacteraceae bacterium]